MTGHSLDAAARDLFIWALANDRAGEVLSHLFDGGAVTRDAANPTEWLLIPGVLVRELADGEDSPA